MRLGALIGRKRTKSGNDFSFNGFRALCGQPDLTAGTDITYALEISRRKRPD